MDHLKRLQAAETRLLPSALQRTAMVRRPFAKSGGCPASTDESPAAAAAGLSSVEAAAFSLSFEHCRAFRTKYDLLLASWHWMGYDKLECVWGFP